MKNFFLFFFSKKIFLSNKKKQQQQQEIITVRSDSIITFDTTFFVHRFDSNDLLYSTILFIFAMLECVCVCDVFFWWFFSFLFWKLFSKCIIFTYIIDIKKMRKINKWIDSYVNRFSRCNKSIYRFCFLFFLLLKQKERQPLPFNIITHTLNVNVNVQVFPPI